MTKVFAYTTDVTLRVETEDKTYVAGTTYAFLVPDDFDPDLENDRWWAEMTKEVRWANGHASGTRTVINMPFEEWLAIEYQQLEYIEVADE